MADHGTTATAPAPGTLKTGDSFVYVTPTSYNLSAAGATGARPGDYCDGTTMAPSD